MRPGASDEDLREGALAHLGLSGELGSRKRTERTKDVALPGVAALVVVVRVQVPGVVDETGLELLELVGFFADLLDVDGADVSGREETGGAAGAALALFVEASWVGVVEVALDDLAVGLDLGAPAVVARRRDRVVVAGVDVGEGGLQPRALVCAVGRNEVEGLAGAAKGLSNARTIGDRKKPILRSGCPWRSRSARGS